MRVIAVAFLATTLVVSSAFASGAPLPSGKPAGVKQAAVLGPNFAVILLGMGVVIGGVTLAVSNNSGNGVSSSTTTSTSSSGLP